MTDRPTSPGEREADTPRARDLVRARPLMAVRRYLDRLTAPRAGGQHPDAPPGARARGDAP